ncbi:hypothetical protein Tco_0840566 [Tanacetum coccineum]|uniref:Uncharacterized protein n=1 Tax=Tanacetum coccineum TaxID=301880 RepID=A0ABQ5AYB8_9ASTR
MVTCCGKRAELLGSEERWRALGILHKISTSRQQLSIGNLSREDDRGVSKGREDVRKVFQQRGSGAKRKLSRCGRNQMGNEPILAFPEGADDFVFISFNFSVKGNDYPVIDAVSMLIEAFVGFFWEAKHQIVVLERDRLKALMDCRGTWYYSLGVFLEIVDVFVRSEFEISSWRGARVDVRTYLLGGAIDSSEANGIIRDPKLELENSRFTFDLVPLSYESVDVVVGENWLLRHKAEMVCHEKVVKMPWVHGDDVAKTVFRMRNGHVEVYGYAFWVNQCTNGFHGVNEPGGVRVAREDDRGVSEGREDVHEVFQQRGSGAKRKLSRCGRNQMGNEPILALPEGADDFVVYYDARSKDLEACLEKGEGDCLYVATTEEAYTTKYSIHPGADTMLCGFRLTNRWLSMKKDIASCGSKYLAYSEVEVEYQGSSGLLLQPELPE